MNLHKKHWLSVIRIVLSILFLIISVLTLAWCIVCFAGGPDGRIGSPETLRYGSEFLLISLLCGCIFVLMNGKNRWAMLTLGGLYEVIVGLLTLLYFIGCIWTSIEYRIWSFPAFFLQIILWSIILAIGYGLYRLMKKRRNDGS